MGGFARIIKGLTPEAAVPKAVMNDAIRLKALRTTSSLLSKTLGPKISPAA